MPPISRPARRAAFSLFVLGAAVFNPAMSCAQGYPPPSVGVVIVEPQRVEVVQTTVYAVSLFDLLKAYGAIKQREQRPVLRIMAMELYSVEEAIQRLGRMLGELPGWCSLANLLPADLGKEPLKVRSAVASTFAASLEMVRQGKARLRQDGTFGPIYLQGVRETS